ncbi:MAG: polyphosphate kinase [Nonlabens sp.]|jgi:polyphosphate kinase
MDICWKDNTKAREICAKQLNNYVVNDELPVRSQYATYEFYKNQITK